MGIRTGDTFEKFIEPPIWPSGRSRRYFENKSNSGDFKGNRVIVRFLVHQRITRQVSAPFQSKEIETIKSLDDVKGFGRLYNGTRIERNVIAKLFAPPRVPRDARLPLQSPLASSHFLFPTGLLPNSLNDDSSWKLALSRLLSFFCSNDWLFSGFRPLLQLFE